MINNLPFKFPTLESQYNLVKFLNESNHWNLTLPNYFPSDKVLKDGEQILLVVYLANKGNISAIDQLWDALQEPVGFKKERAPQLRTSPKDLRLAPTVSHEIGAFWTIINQKEQYKRELNSKGAVGPKSKFTFAEAFMMFIHCPQLFMQSKDDLTVHLHGHQIRDYVTNTWADAKIYLCKKENKICLLMHDAVDSFDNRLSPEFTPVNP